MDINLILKLFWSINYFKGVIVVYNYALQDYKTPIEEFVRYIDEVPKDKIESSVINTFLIAVPVFCNLSGVNCVGMKELQFMAGRDPIIWLYNSIQGQKILYNQLMWDCCTLCTTFNLMWMRTKKYNIGTIVQQN